MVHGMGLQLSSMRMDETRVRLTDAERKDRAAQLQRTMSLLVHASGCRDPKCRSTSCNKVKALFAHAVSCQAKVTGGCPLCRCPHLITIMTIPLMAAVWCTLRRAIGFLPN